MTNGTPNTGAPATADSTILNRENLPALRQSIRREFDMVRHQLGLPQLDTLREADEVQVLEAIATHMANTRNAAAQLDPIRNVLAQHFQQEIANSTLAQHEAPQLAADAAEHENLIIADALLKTIYRNFTDEDIRQFIQQLPAAIRPIQGDFWEATITTGIGFPPSSLNGETVRIDLTNPLWITGNTRESIRNYCAGRTPAQLGITVTGRNGGVAIDAPLSAEDIRDIFDSRVGVVDRQLSVNAVQLNGVPAGHNTTVDIPAILRDHRNIASMASGAMETEILAHLADYQQYFRSTNIAGGNDVPVTPADVPAIVTALFTQLSRPIGSPFASRMESLTDALNGRSALDRIVSGNAKNREKMLSLITMQRDPLAVDAIEPRTADTERLTRQRRVAEIVSELRALQAVQAPQPLPVNTSLADLNLQRTHVVADITALETSQTTWSGQEHGYQTALQAYNIDLNAHQAEQRHHDSVQSQNERASQNYQAQSQAALRAVIAAPVAPTPLPLPLVRPLPTQPAAPIFAPVILTSAFGTIPLLSIADVRTKLAELRTTDRELQNAISILGQRGQSLVELFQFLQQLNIADLPTNFPALCGFLNIAGPALNPAALLANSDFAQVVRQVEQNFPGGLQSVEHYAQELQRLRSTGTGVIDSNACWTIVRRGLENQGIRGQELERTVAYMRARIDVTPENIEDARHFAEDAIPQVGQPDADAINRWNQGKSFRRLRWLGLRQFNAYETYAQHLFHEEGVGLALDANPRQHPLPTLIHAYFRTKYLCNLPADNPRRLPNTQTITNFLRDLHGAIIEKGQTSLTQATLDSGLGQRDLDALRANGMGVEANRLPTMSVTERRQAIHAYLSGETYYTDARKRAIESMAEAAYHHVEQAKERHEAGIRWRNGSAKFAARAGGWTIGIGSVYNPVTYPARVLKFAGWTVPKGVAVGVAKGVKAVTYDAPKAVVQGTWKHKWALAGAAGLTAIGGPVGAIIGAFVVAKSLRDKGGAPAVSPAH